MQYFLILLLSLSACASTSNHCRHDQSSFRCVEYVRNYDGDTITVNIAKVHPIIGEEISIRLLDVDTPELRTNDDCERTKGYEARDFVSERLQTAKRIDLLHVSRDKYFRIDAELIYDGKSLGQELLNHKLAVPYGIDVDWCSQ